MLLGRLPDPLVVAACSPPDAHGYVSLGTNADYVAPFIGHAPFFVEANPRCRGRSAGTASTCPSWRGGARSDRPLVEVHSPDADAVDQAIADLVADRIPNGSCIQAGIGAIPSQVLARLTDHRDLGIHTELLSDGAVALVESGRRHRRSGRCDGPGRSSRRSPSARSGSTTSSTATAPSSCSRSTG